MKKFGAFCLITSATLSACSDTTKEKLIGERVDIQVETSSVKVDPDARKDAFILPTEVDVQNWPQAYGNASHYLPHVRIEDRVRRAWDYGLGSGSSDEATLLNGPVILGNTIYASNTSGEVYAVSLDEGDPIWDTELELPEEELLDANPGLAVTNEALYATFQSGDIFALNPKNGDILWHTNIGVPLRGAPTLMGHALAVVGQNNSLHVLSQSDGSLKWTHNGLEERLALQGGASVAISPKSELVVPYSSGEIYALHAETGKYLWHDALSFNVGADPYSSLLDINASPVIADGVLYAVNYNGRFSAFHMESGRRLWSLPMSATQTPLVVGSLVYVVDEKGQMICINRKRGLVRWIQDLNTFIDEDERDEPRTWTSTILAGERLFTASSDGYVLTLNPRTGELDKRADIGDAMTLSPVAANSTVIFFTDDARLVAFR